MEKKISFTLSSSLKRRTLVKIVVTLWQQDAIDLAFGPRDRYEIERQWCFVEDLMFQKVLKLPLPELLKNEVSRFVAASSQQILQWITNTTSPIILEITRKGLSKFSWTPLGIIDKKKTAEVFVRDESLDIAERFKLACNYCLEDYISVLWDQLEESVKVNLKHAGIYEEPLVSFWSYFMGGEITQLGDIMSSVCENDNATHYEFAFRCSALSINETSTKYFYQNLTPEERDRNLVKTATDLINGLSFRYLDKAYNTYHYSNILCFLFSQMEGDQQLEVFKWDPFKVLMSVLMWPWQDFFMTTAQRMWNFIKDGDYFWVLHDIVCEKIGFRNHKYPGFRDYDYQKLFEIFWQQTPISLKKTLIDNPYSFELLVIKLFKAEDTENIKLIFSDPILAEGKKLIFCHRLQMFCQHVISDDEWDLLKFFFKECVSSKHEIVKFKEGFQNLIKDPCFENELEIEKDKWNKFFQLLDDLIYGCNKRENMEEAV